MVEDERWRREQWPVVAAENRARIEALEKEAERQRERLHELAATVGTIAVLALQIKTLAEEVTALGERFERVARRTLSRPSAGGFSAAASWVAVAVAVLSIILATRP